MAEDILIKVINGNMSRIDKLIASMPPKMANAVIHQRKLHSCLMELTSNKSREVAARAIFLNYLDGDGRKLGTIPHYYERPTTTGSVMVETYFSYIDRVH